MRKEKAITLVSLVVTIIVLVILAGVSINLVLGENEIITRAKQAKTKTEQATLNEQTALNELYIQMESEFIGVGGTSNPAIAKLAEFKREIANAITDMGVPTSSNADTTTMASNIRNISGTIDSAIVRYWNPTTSQPNYIDSQYLAFISDTQYNVLKDMYNVHMFLGYTQGQSGSSFTSYIYVNGQQVGSHCSSNGIPTEVAFINVLNAGDVITLSFPAPAYGGAASHNFMALGSGKANVDIVADYPLVLGLIK